MNSPERTQPGPAMILPLPRIREHPDRCVNSHRRSAAKSGKGLQSLSFPGLNDIGRERARAALIAVNEPKRRCARFRESPALSATSSSTRLAILGRLSETLATAAIGGSVLGLIGVPAGWLS